MDRALEIKRIRKIIRLFLLAFLLAFLCEILLNIDYDGVFDTYENDFTNNNYTFSELKVSEAEILKDGRVICKEDPKITIESLDCYVHSVKLKYHDLSSDRLEAGATYIADSAQAVAGFLGVSI